MNLLRSPVVFFSYCFSAAVEVYYPLWPSGLYFEKTKTKQKTNTK